MKLAYLLLLSFNFIGCVDRTESNILDGIK